MNSTSCLARSHLLLRFGEVDEEDGLLVDLSARGAGVELVRRCNFVCFLHLAFALRPLVPSAPSMKASMPLVTICPSPSASCASLKNTWFSSSSTVLPKLQSFFFRA